MIKHKLCTNKACAHEWDDTGDEYCSWCDSPGRTIELLRPYSMQAMISLVHKMREQRGGETK